MQPWEFPFLCFVVVLVGIGSFVSASAGFGFAIVMVAVLQFFMPPVALVGTVLILTSATSLMRIVETRRTGLWKKSFRFVLAAFAGVPIGVMMLKHLDPIVMRRYLNTMLLIGVGMMMLGTRRARDLPPVSSARGATADVFVGFLSGFLGGSCTLSGPPIVLWGVLQRWRKTEMHAVWARFFFSVALFSLGNLTVNGMVEARTVTTSLSMLPATFVGFTAGTYVRNRISEARFRIYVLSLLAVSGVTGFVMSFN